MSKDQDLPERMLKAAEVAELLNISRAHVYNLMKRGELPFVKVGESLRVRPKDLARYIDENMSI